jgi:diaminopimelate decarboxylase
MQITQEIYYKNKQLYIEDIPVADLAKTHGTPLYIYSRSALIRNWQNFTTALSDYPHLICYAVKANSNLAILNTLAQNGAGFDIVSLGELERVLAAGGNANQIVFSGIGKQAHEIKSALEVGIYCFNVESSAELELLNQIARDLNKQAPVSLRINPNVDAKTHPYITTGLTENKFGIPSQNALELYLQAAQLSHIEIKGIDCHIGSQITAIDPFLQALDQLLALTDTLTQHHISIQHIDLGGGLGISYSNEETPTTAEYITAILHKLRARNIKLILEPGRAIVGNVGILVTHIDYLKPSTNKNFAIVDAGMNDLLRPALYNAWQDIIPVCINEEIIEKTYDIVGPVCETADFLGKDRRLRIQTGDLLAVTHAGAYSFVMSSNYNSRPRACEVMVSGQQAQVVRKREAITELFAYESIFR